MKNTQSLKLNRDFRRAYKGDNFVGGYTVVYMKKNKKLNSEGIEKTQVNNTSVYFFTLLIQAVDKLLELLGTAIIFGLTSLGLTIIFNESLRNIVFQMLGLK